jgi:hypothetical protein
MGQTQYLAVSLGTAHVLISHTYTPGIEIIYCISIRELTGTKLAPTCFKRVLCMYLYVTCRLRLCSTRYSNFLDARCMLILSCCKMKEVGGWDIMRKFDLHTSKARYELKVVPLARKCKDDWRIYKTFHSLIYHIETCAIIILRYCR